jgi:hypothetical protein
VTNVLYSVYNPWQRRCLRFQNGDVSPLKLAPICFSFTSTVNLFYFLTRAVKGRASPIYQIDFLSTCAQTDMIAFLQIDQNKIKENSASTYHKCFHPFDASPGGTKSRKYALPNNSSVPWRRRACALSIS